jgi:hypothetical protein
MQLVKRLVCSICGLTAQLRRRKCCPEDFYYECPAHGEVRLVTIQEWV